MVARKRQEDTDIDQLLYPKFDSVGINRTFIKRNITTDKSGRQRGDIWIADINYNDVNYEKRILALIECKDHFCSLGDSDWEDAKKQGKEKSLKQNLKSYFITNTSNHTRCYNSYNDEEISIDSKIINDIQAIPILRAIQTQVNRSNSNVLIESFSPKKLDPKEFRTSLWNIRQIFRSRGISKGSEDTMIKTTLTFGILKLITEQQKLSRTIPQTIFLWDDWRQGQVDREINNTIKDLVSLLQYSHLKDCLLIDSRLDSEACQKIKEELNYDLYGSDFDFFGLIYESLANKEIKKDFGEFYTPRHIIRTIVKLRLKDELHPRPLSICDPACGTGGFLVESFLFLQRNFEKSNSLNPNVINELKNKVFYGFDTNEIVAIPFARTNMIMADDGGVNIKPTQDSLIDLPENKYDYILTNVPYGLYDGRANIENFSYTNNRRFELLFVEKITKALKPGGKAAIIVPDGLVESTSNSDYRKNLLLDVNIEAIISLPSFVFEPYTTEKTYVLFFSKKMPSETGSFQKTPIWHCVIDNDGFQKGKKRYPINENDLPQAEESFLRDQIDNFCDFISIDEINEETYYSLCSEFFLRRIEPVEISEEQFNSILEEAEKLIQ